MWLILKKKAPHSTRNDNIFANMTKNVFFKLIGGYLRSVFTEIWTKETFFKMVAKRSKKRPK